MGLALSAGVYAAEPAAYVSLNQFARENRLEFKLDAILKNATVASANGFVKFHAGSPYLLANDKLEKLSGSTVLLSQDVLIPNGALKYLDSLKPAFEEILVPSRIRRIMVDAGHGGKDFGAVSKRGTVEKEITLDIALKLKNELQLLGFEVLLTRASDMFIPLEERAQSPSSRNADIFVSVHANASPSKSLRGFEVYYLSDASDSLAMAVERAENAAARYDKNSSMADDKSVKTIYWDMRQTENRRESGLMAKYIGDRVGEGTEISANRIRSANFHVLRRTDCPAVLIETGYITNAQDERRLKDPNYRYELAHAIALGILNYAKEYERTDAFTR